MVFLKIAKILIYFLVFLLPLFFLPWTANVLDFPKQTILLLLVFLSLISWLALAVIEGKISLNLNPFNLVIIIFLLILGIATLFSFYPYGSFWGLPLNISQSFITVFGFLLLYFLIVNIFSKREVFYLLLILIFSSLLAILFGIFQIFGQFIFPFDFSRDISFNTIGTVNSFGIFSGAILPLVLVLIFITKRIIKFFLFGFGILFLFSLFLVNFWLAWISLFVGSAFLLIFGIARREIFQIRWLTLPMFLLVLSFIFGFLRISFPGLPFTPTPLEVSPSQAASFEIAIKTLKELPTTLFLGSGPGTFVYDYSKFKSETLNQTAFWSVRFASGASEILDKLASTGILGLLSFLAILGVFFWLAIKSLKSDIKLLSLGIFASWLGVVVSLFFYPANLSLSFLFWIFIASFIALANGKIKSWSFETSPKIAILFSFIFIFFLILGISLGFLASQRYLGEIRYLQGLKAVQRGDNQMAIDYFLRAISQTAGKQDNYWRDLSQVYLFRINEELQRKELPQEEISRIITPLLTNAISAAKAATDVGPKNVANWAVRGFVYRNLAGLIGGAEEWAIKSYQEAIRLEPTNPYLATELGQVYLGRNEIEKARENFEKAISLKPDYIPGHFQIAMTFVREGEKDKAIKKFEEIRQIIPDNEEVKKILANLRAGKPALEGVVPGQPPIEEIPPERIEK